MCIPSLALTEWHPFTISSAPERADSLTLHVRSLGDWTTRLYTLAQERERILAQKGKVRTNWRRLP